MPEMSTKNILLICGTLNQTKAMLEIGRQLSEHRCYYTPFYCDGHLLRASKRGWLDFTAVAGPLRERCARHLREAGVEIDDRGEARDYDLVITCTDLIIQQNLYDKRIVLVQEGLTEPEDWVFWLVKHLGVPRVFANTAAFGLSDAYEVFCVASEGSRDLFIKKGIRPEKMVITGIPNFDNARAYLDNDFPHKDFVLVCTSNARETFKKDDRMGFLRKSLAIAGKRPIIFKLHPAERHDRAISEIQSLVPDATILREGNTEHMIANCSAIVAQYSTVAFTAAALGKEVHSYIKPDVLRRILPIQNGGTSAVHIAEVCRGCLESTPSPARIQRVRSDVEPRASVAALPLPLGDIRLMPR
jgi:hypothetical protein